MFVIEEHHEAFIVWAYAIRKGIISPGCQLLHFDDHSDLSAPVFNTSVNNILEMPLEEIKEFVYEQMRIDTFIIPAVYLGIINEIAWVRQDMSVPLNTDMFVRSFNEEGKKLIAGKAGPNNQQLRPFRYSKMSAPQFDSFEVNDNGVLLDIDLDYFSCTEDPYSKNTVIIEITENEYNEFAANKYHYLRYLVSSIKAVQKGTSYYYIINHFKDIYPSSREVMEQEIEDRIHIFTESLLRKKIRPELITICNSAHSGFTPSDQVEFIRGKLLNSLHELFELEPTDFNHYTLPA
jgi:hypothetical protein